MPTSYGKAVHKKEYSSIHHEMAALKKWRNNLKLVTEHNQQYLTGETSYSLHLNHFADLSATEYFRKILKLFHTTPMFDPAEDHHRTAYRRSLKNRVPEKGLSSSTWFHYSQKGHCRYSRRLVSVTPRRWAMLPPRDEEAMERALSGIYDDPFCLPWQLNHAMLLVGYTPEYWILLNWWGKDWGEDGTIITFLF
ncbi:Cathepsin L-like proteinase [Operophtera brumata]|uniref:Cathepsin L-like proteinase n=1 Tax=Operophtera brumata TaxID=104452 RepID=A0A0L7LBM0_OPEBR|nr:Cathepsin L-like proteinase [Operophtera brumata]